MAGSARRAGIARTDRGIGRPLLLAERTGGIATVVGGHRPSVAAIIAPARAARRVSAEHGGWYKSAQVNQFDSCSLTFPLHRSQWRWTFGRRAPSSPMSGRYAQTLYTVSMLVWSASQPSAAAPRPAIPNENPKNSPEIMPTLPGTRSCAKTTIAGNADARINPIATVSGPVQN